MTTSHGNTRIGELIEKAGNIKSLDSTHRETRLRVNNANRAALGPAHVLCRRDIEHRNQVGKFGCLRTGGAKTAIGVAESATFSDNDDFEARPIEAARGCDSTNWKVVHECRYEVSSISLRLRRLVEKDYSTLA